MSRFLVVHDLLLLLLRELKWSNNLGRLLDHFSSALHLLYRVGPAKRLESLLIFEFIRISKRWNPSEIII